MFDNHFEVFLADTPEGKDIHYSIRYQVYCEEMGFENKDQFPEEMELDNDDDRSIHFIIKNKMNNQWVGAMRLIYQNDGFLPIEQLCNLDKKINNNDGFGTVEMSRLCIIKDVRRGIKDIDPPNGIADVSQMPIETDKIKILNNNKLNRMIIWGLFRAAAVYCNKHNMQYCYFMTTKILARVLRRGGLNLINIGKVCQHKGERFPFTLDAISTYHSDIWQDDYKQDYRLFSELSNSQFEKLRSVA